jgi:hypothetical protein
MAAGARSLSGWQRWLRRAALLSAALCAARLFAPWWCGREAGSWFRGEERLTDRLAAELIAFEADDDRRGPPRVEKDRFAGEWTLATHQMTALGLAQLALARPALRHRYTPIVTRAALKSFSPELRRFGPRAWHGEDALASVGSSHGHAYLAYPALAVGMARWLDREFPARAARSHDALIAAYERRLLASRTGLIETYPGEAYPTDVAAVAAAIAVHGRVTHVDHSRALHHWADAVRAFQIDPKSGLVIQRMGAADGRPHDAPRGSGTGLAAYYAGFADRQIARLLAEALFRHESTFAGFGAIREYADGHSGRGDIDSGPVVLGVSVAATGFALAPARAFGRRDLFTRIYRTVDLFGLPISWGGRYRFCTGGPIGNALLLAFLTSGPELSP